MTNITLQHKWIIEYNKYMQFCNCNYHQLRDKLTSMDDSVKTISLELSAFGWSKLSIFILTCRGFMKMRSLKSLFAFNKYWMHASLSIFPHLLEFNKSTILFAYFSWLSSGWSGFLLSFKYRAAFTITCKTTKSEISEKTMKLKKH